MTPSEPAGEVRQASLFATPLCKLYELQDALVEDKKMVSEMEKDYPEELLDLISQAKIINEQIKESKDEFLKELQADSVEYIEARNRAAQTKIELDEAIRVVYEMANEATAEGGHIDETIEVNGTIVRFQTQRLSKVEVYLNGKEL